MLKTAIIIALKRDWWLIVSVVMSTAIVQYWREHHVSFLGLFVSLLAALVVFFLAKVPPELHKLRNPR